MEQAAPPRKTAPLGAAWPSQMPALHVNEAHWRLVLQVAPAGSPPPPPSFRHLLETQESERHSAFVEHVDPPGSRVPGVPPSERHFPAAHVNDAHSLLLVHGEPPGLPPTSFHEGGQ